MVISKFCKFVFVFIDVCGIGDEFYQCVGGGYFQLIIVQGILVVDNQNFLCVMLCGLMLLEDFILCEKIIYFDYECIFECIVYVCGSVVYGYFELICLLGDYMCVWVLSEVGVCIFVFICFFIVVGGVGLVDMLCDVCGFVVKFYICEGNWDLVGNNILVFFIQDVIKFFDLIYVVKMELDCVFFQVVSVYDMFWDFILLMFELMYMVMWVMSDCVILCLLCMIEGFGIYSFCLFNDVGEFIFVKFYWCFKLGLQFIVWDEVVKLQGVDNDFYWCDLFELISVGDFFEWELVVQLFIEEEVDVFLFDYLDLIKIIFELLVLLMVVGWMVLDCWLDNFFVEIEQVVYCLVNVLLGIDFSNDLLLQGCLFFYLDMQLSWLGGLNFYQILINIFKCFFVNYQCDGYMQMDVFKGWVVYELSLLQDDSLCESVDGFFSYVIVFDDGCKGCV